MPYIHEKDKDNRFNADRLHETRCQRRRVLSYLVHSSTQPAPATMAPSFDTLSEHELHEEEEEEIDFSGELSPYVLVI